MSKQEKLKWVIHNEFRVSHFHEFFHGQQKREESQNSFQYHAYVFVYDVNQPSSFEKTFKVLKMIIEAEKNLQRGQNDQNSEVPFKMVLGNKMDLLGKQQISKEQLEELMKN